MQVSPQQLGALDIVPPIQLLIDTMRAIGRTPHGQQQHVLARSLLKRKRDGDTASLPRHVGLDTKDLLHCLCRSLEVPMERTSHPPLSIVLAGNVKCVLAAEVLELVADVLENQLIDLVALDRKSVV